MQFWIRPNPIGVVADVDLTRGADKTLLTFEAMRIKADNPHSSEFECTGLSNDSYRVILRMSPFWSSRADGGLPANVRIRP